MAPDTPIFAHNLTELYDVWVAFLSIVVVALFAHFVIRPFFLFRPPLPDTTCTRRGRCHAAVHAPVCDPFHPQLPPVEDGPVFNVVLGVIDNVVRPAMHLAWTGMNVAFLLVGKINRTLSRPYLVETFVLPIKIRVRQAIAQMPVPAIPSSGMPYRYICPTSFVLALFPLMVSVFGVSIFFAGLVCFVCVVTFYAADRMGVGEDDENVVSETGSIPEMTGVGQVAVLNG